MLLRPAADWALLTCNCCKSSSPRGAFAAILAADVVGYTRLMGADETGTLRRLTELRQQVLEPLIAEFPSAKAVQCAVEIQNYMGHRNADVPEGRRITYRIGINIGDIVAEDDDIYGDGVNVAARLLS